MLHPCPGSLFQVNFCSLLETVEAFGYKDRYIYIHILMRSNELEFHVFCKLSKNGCGKKTGSYTFRRAILAKYC